MKRLLFIIILFITHTVNAQDRVLPNITLTTLEGTKFNLTELTNYKNPIILTLWATWCKPCKKELNNIHEVYEEWQLETGVEVFAVSTDDSRSSAKVKPYVDAMGWDFKIFRDSNGDLVRALNVSSIPHLFLIKEGKIIYEHKGYIEGDEEELYKKIKSIN